jgi:small-conductance mechanosensitive channel
MVLGNTLLRWIIALSVTAAALVLGRLAQKGIHAWMARRAEGAGRLFDQCLASLAGHTHVLFLLALAITCGWQFLELTPRLEHRLDLLLPVALVLQAAGWGHRAVGLWIDRQFRGPAQQSATSASRAAVLGFVLRLALWSLVLLLALDVLGFNITTLVASLGIGGIAVALAVQNILGDLFASLSIALDKPFMVGDFIQMGDRSDPCLGVVEFIGLKTTRIRSLSGEQIVVANGDLLKSRIRNFKKMLERRVVFNVWVAYRTPPALLERIPEEIRRLIEALPMARFDRAHLFEFSDAGLKYEVVYYVLSPDYNLYMDLQQAINLGILRTFQREGISFAFPARILITENKDRPKGPSHPPARVPTQLQG